LVLSYSTLNLYYNLSLGVCNIYSLQLMTQTSRQFFVLLNCVLYQIFCHSTLDRPASPATYIHRYNLWQQIKPLNFIHWKMTNYNSSIFCKTIIIKTVMLNKKKKNILKLKIIKTNNIVEWNSKSFSHRYLILHFQYGSLLSEQKIHFFKNKVQSEECAKPIYKRGKNNK